MTDVKDVEIFLDMKRKPNIKTLQSDPFSGLDKSKMFAIDDGNNICKLDDMICPYTRRTCKKELCGIFDIKNNQCAVVTNAQNSGSKSVNADVTTIQNKTEGKGILVASHHENPFPYKIQKEE